MNRLRIDLESLNTNACDQRLVLRTANGSPVESAAIIGLAVLKPLTDFCRCVRGRIVGKRSKEQRKDNRRMKVSQIERGA